MNKVKKFTNRIKAAGKISDESNIAISQTC